MSANAQTKVSADIVKSFAFSTWDPATFTLRM